ncbi:DcrB-related protein [Pantoea stewartii]|uniref:DcrB-related protein n=1 Tax=Pantoea stewartii TaxID=66269 RepID=UPI001627C4DC|nr:DcrB-related protein [Pantoea stewartii]MBC0853025.1 DcrB-related protein [Pantoea stewartii]
MNYQFNEGAFALFPAAWQDTTMNILRDEASGLAFVVSRGVIPEGNDAETEFQRQWDTLRSQMGAIQQTAFVRVMAGIDSALQALEVETAFERNGQAVWQRQLATQVPDSNIFMIFTLSAMRPFNEEDGERWKSFKHSLSLNNPRKA